MYAALASQKNHMTVYLTAIYIEDADREASAAEFRATGKRCGVGKSCVGFRHLDDLPLEVIGRAIASTSVDDFVKRV